MPFKKFIRDAIIGKGRFIPSRSTYKTSMIRGYFSMLLIAICLVNGTMDEWNSIEGNRIVYLSLIVAGIVTFLLNRKGRTLAANLILLLLSDFVVFLYASTYKNDNAIYVFFISSALFAINLFDYRQKAAWISCAALPYILFLVSRYYDFHLIDKTGLTEIMVTNNFIANFTLAYVVSVMLLVFVINMNYHSENELRKNEARLIEAGSQLAKSRERYELAIQSSNAGIWQWDIASNTLDNSPVWRSMLGYESHELQGMKIEHFVEKIHPDDRAMVKREIEAHLSRDYPYKAEFRMMKKDGNFIWVQDSGIAVRNEEGFSVQMVGSIIDITERKEAEEKIILQNNMLAKTNAELDRFVYSTSHDLRSPLSSLLGLITIAEKTDDEEEVAACLLMMKDRIRTMETFIKEIIDYSRNTRLAVKRAPVRLFPLINEIVENLRFSEGAENIFVRYNVPPELDLYSDENRLRVVLNNLIGNSIKYYDITSDNPYISVEAYAQHDSIHLTIEDNGIGIGKEHQARIFDMFYRASEKSHGSGLGLYIVKETIEKLGGTIGVDSEPGKGTRFLIRFPMVVQHDSVDTETPVV